jgi:hypothetical protein
MIIWTLNVASYIVQKMWLVNVSSHDEKQEILFFNFPMHISKILLWKFKFKLWNIILKSENPAEIFRKRAITEDTVWESAECCLHDNLQVLVLLFLLWYFPSNTSKAWHHRRRKCVFCILRRSFLTHLGMKLLILFLFKLLLLDLKVYLFEL